jgi:ribosomal protection tetracycline resistance protein
VAGSGVSLESRRNVGLVAHVDAGKTTIAEQMLWLSGRIRTAGSVDDGTAQTDYLDVERERGISVRMATTVLPWQGHSINLVDTPGHVDFVAEVERSLQVLDGAVLIISAAEGVQSHTETIWHALRQRQLPAILFINKVDRMGANVPRVLAEVASALTDRAVPLDLAPEALAERLAELDDETLERYLTDGAVDSAWLRTRLAELSRAGKVFPVLCGAAKHGLGVRELLDAILELLPPPSGSVEAPLSGVVFKVERDPAMGRTAYVRLFGGRVANRGSVWSAGRELEAKVSQIRKMYARHHEDTGVLEAGDIGVLCGLGNVRAGEILGDSAGVPPLAQLAAPVLSARVHPAPPGELPKLVEALQELTDEDPLLDLRWIPEVRELHVKMTGAIQLEVLGAMLKVRFGLGATFDPPSVIYQETPSQPGEGFVAYTMPKPCWAVLRFAIEPGQRGSGLQYRSAALANEILPSYQREVERQVPEALRQGLSGWNVTDLKVTLTYGQHHVVHTHPLDWSVATPMGIMDGLTNTGTTLLEPLYAFRISVPEEAAGRVLGHLIQMRGQFDSPVIAGGRFLVEGTLPVATSLDYPVRLSAAISGRGVISTRFAGYSEAPPEVKAVRPRVGVDPRDRAKYILSVRGAL